MWRYCDGWNVAVDAAGGATIGLEEEAAKTLGKMMAAVALAVRGGMVVVAVVAAAAAAAVLDWEPGGEVKITSKMLQ